MKITILYAQSKFNNNKVNLIIKWSVYYLQYNVCYSNNKIITIGLTLYQYDYKS